MATITEELYNEKREASAKYEKAFDALLKIDASATQLSAVLECEIDYLLGMNLAKIDGEYHEKILALTEIAERLVRDMRETFARSDAA